MVRKRGECNSVKAIILAGGLGTRLKERVSDVPKPMAPVAGRPFLEFILDRLDRAGIQEVILSVGYLSEVIQSYFSNKYKSIAIRYCVEDTPLGTGGAIIHALKGLPDEPLLVLNGDTLLDINYGELIQWYSGLRTSVAVVLRAVDDISRYGSVEVEDEVLVHFKEKGGVGPGLINAGVYIICPHIFSGYELPVKFSFENDFLQKYCASLLPRAYVTEAYFIDIGIPEDYDRAARDLTHNPVL